MGDNDLLFGEKDDLFQPEDVDADGAKAEGEKPAWKLLIVDDEEEVHTTTRLVLEDFEFEGLGLEFLSAFTGAEALEMMREHNDIAVVLLDVVMETPDAGLNCARAIRQELENKLVRIVLRTGQPGQAPERKVIVEYDINDYKNKSEITSQRLFSTVYTAIRSYNDMYALEKQRRGLKCIIDASGELFRQDSIKKLASGVLTQIEGLYRLANSIYVSGTVVTAPNAFMNNVSKWELMAATGEYSSCQIDSGCSKLDENTVALMNRAIKEKKSLFVNNRYVGYFPTDKDKSHLIYIEDQGSEHWQELQDLLQVFTNNVGIAIDKIYLNQEIIETQTEVVLRLGEVVESRSKETANHVVRVAEYSRIMALAYGIEEKEAEIIKLASPMHDVGKIGIPDSVLLKPGKLTPEEYAVIKTHTDIGYKILSGSERVLLREAATIAYTHHERWDGNGYPRGLAGEDIPITGRITALADVFDALSHARVYKEAWPLDKVFKFITDERGKMFDPRLVDLFFECKDEIVHIRTIYRDKF